MTRISAVADTGCVGERVEILPGISGQTPANEIRARRAGRISGRWYPLYGIRCIFGP